MKNFLFFSKQQKIKKGLNHNENSKNTKKNFKPFAYAFNVKHKHFSTFIRTNIGNR